MKTPESAPALLRANRYPGRGILLGRTADGLCAVAAYFIMGRSQNSRNRVFTPTPDGIRTQAFDPSKMQDPSLIIYHPVRELPQGLIVTNGDQTDTIRDALLAGGSFQSALHTRTFEPDAPNYTPRISGLLRPAGDFSLSILKSTDGNPACCCRYFFDYDRPEPGTGRLLHTYESDGAPLPSFAGEPRTVSLTGSDAHSLAAALWDALDAENRVSLYVSLRPLSGGEACTLIVNKNA